MEKVADLSVAGPVLGGRRASPAELYDRLVAGCAFDEGEAMKVVVVMRAASFAWLAGRANRVLYPGRGTDEVGRDTFWCMDCRTTDEDLLDFMVYDTLWLLGMTGSADVRQSKPDGIICIDCFARRLAAKGHKLTWRDLQPVEVNLKHRLRLEGNKE